MDNAVIRVENLSKIYKVYNQPIDRLKESLHPFRKTYHQDFYALKDVTFEVNRGETMGIIGKNGSGKSTLLKIITGILSVTSGNVEVNGRVAALLELGASFNHEMTGIENIYLNGMIMGYPKNKIDSLLDDIVAFADIGDFVNRPVKTYSSGMFARLAFAVNSHVNPDVLIVDEALAVGDMFFQFKCIRRMKLMQEQGATILFVSHDISTVKSFCTKAIWLNEGRIACYGDVEKVAGRYQMLSVEARQDVNVPKHNHTVAELSIPNSASMYLVGVEAFQQRAAHERRQNGRAEFLNIQLVSASGDILKQVSFGQAISLRMLIKVISPINGYLCTAYQIRDRNGYEIVYSDFSIEDKKIVNPQPGDDYLVEWCFNLRLKEGKYNILCNLYRPVDILNGNVEFCDWVTYAVQFEVLKRDKALVHGGVYWDNDVQIKKISGESSSKI